MTEGEIDEINRLALSTPATYMNDLGNLEGEYDASQLSQNLTTEPLPSCSCYVNREIIDENAYFGAFKTAILETGYTGTRDVEYAICVRGTEIIP